MCRVLINCTVLFHKDAITLSCNWVLSVSVCVSFISISHMKIILHSNVATFLVIIKEAKLN